MIKLCILALRTARLMLETFGLSSVQLTQMCDTRDSFMTGSRFITIQKILAPSSVKLKAQALWWSWRPKC